MPSNAFNASNPTKKPPPYCKSGKTPLPIFFSPILPSCLQAYARWTDLDPADPADISVYCSLSRVGGGWTWNGHAHKQGFTLYVTLSRVVDPQPWMVDLLLFWPSTWFEHTIWTPITFQLEPNWDTGPLQHITVPGLDFRQARVQQ